MRSKAAVEVFLLLTVVGRAQSPALIEKSQHARDLMAASKFEDAVPIYRELVRAVPGNPGLLLNLGMALHLAGHSHEAIGPLESALKIDDNLAPALLFLGDARVGAGEPALALAPLKRYLQLQPDDPGGHQSLGDALLAVNEFAEAASEFRKVAAADKNNPHAWYGLSRCYSALAETSFHKVEKTAPESAYWLALVADERLRRHQLQSAFFFYRRAAEAQPDLPGLHASLADVYEQSGRADWAETERRRERPADCAQQSLACAFIAGRYDDVVREANTLHTIEVDYWQSRAFAQLARECYKRLEELPECAEIHELRASEFGLRRQHLQAGAEWKKALQFAPGDFWLREQLLSSLYEARDYAAALSLVDALLHEEPTSAGLNLTKAEILISQQQAEDAIRYLNTALRQDPTLIAAHEATGRAYLLLGRNAEAIPHLRAALPLDRDGSLRYRLSKAYQAVGQPEKAKQMLAQYESMQKADRDAKRNLESELQITAP